MDSSALVEIENQLERFREIILALQKRKGPWPKDIAKELEPLRLAAKSLTRQIDTALLSPEENLLRY